MFVLWPVHLTHTHRQATLYLTCCVKQEKLEWLLGLMCALESNLRRIKFVMFIYLNKNMGGPVRPSELGRDGISI
jgi:hypothetical protein